MEITKHFDFEAAHALVGCSSKCKNIHGHSYKLEVTVRGSVKKDSGMVIDFSEVKKVVKPLVVDVLDHKLLLGGTSFTREALSLMVKAYGAMEMEEGAILDFGSVPPTAENMLYWILEKIHTPITEKGISLVRLRLYETATCYAEWVIGMDEVVLNLK